MHSCFQKSSGELAFNMLYGTRTLKNVIDQDRFRIIQASYVNHMINICQSHVAMLINPFNYWPKNQEKRGTQCKFTL